MKKISLFILLVIFPLYVHAMGTVQTAVPTPGTAAVHDTEVVPTPIQDEKTDPPGLYTVITGKVIDREDIWDRRSNPLMGRPDQLVEIILTVKPSATEAVTISIKTSRLIVKYKMIATGSRGVFRVTGSAMPYSLVSFEPLRSQGGGNVMPKTTPKPRPTKVPQNYNGSKDLLDEEKIPGREIIKSKELQEKAVKKIAKKYGLENPEFKSLTSFQGPVPPPGGYVYWGVKGMIKNTPYIWQYGYGLRRGSSLEDPQRYNKCNSPDTRILTPKGYVMIKDLKKGGLVMSEGRAVRIIKVKKTRAKNHKVCRVAFSDGAVINVSPGHPLPGGRTIGGLKVGDKAGDRTVIKTSLIPYRHDFTYDILPDSESGIYIANGIELGSTLCEKHPDKKENR